MNPNEVRNRETREWLEKALDDLESARVLAAADHAANALYHCQQSAEKSLKAFLTLHDRPFRKTHNLKELATRAQSSTYPSKGSRRRLMSDGLLLENALPRRPLRGRGRRVDGND